MGDTPLKMIMPYIGKDLSVNYYKIIGRGGRPTNKTKASVVFWMTQLSDKIVASDWRCWGGNVLITLLGKFVDNRAPDMHNLHKVIGDAIKTGLGVDDKGFRFEDLPYEIGYANPVIEITLQEY